MTHTVVIRARHLPPMMNFNFWVEVDGKVIANDVELEKAQQKAEHLASALRCPVTKEDFWVAPA